MTKSWHRGFYYFNYFRNAILKDRIVYVAKWRKRKNFWGSICFYIPMTTDKQWKSGILQILMHNEFFRETTSIISSSHTMFEKNVLFSRTPISFLKWYWRNSTWLAVCVNARFWLILTEMLSNFGHISQKRSVFCNPQQKNT